MLPVKGGVVLLAYTTIDELIRCWGPQKHWIALDARGLARIKETTHYRTMLVDQELPIRLQTPAVRQPQHLDDEDDHWMPDSWLEPVYPDEPRTRRR
jgi:hypothetical protein